MISYLRGVLLEKHPNQAVVDVNGVGYDVTIPISAFSSLPEKGSEVRFYIHTHVREDALALFGFVTTTDKALFEKLITVSGVGPKLAITVLSGMDGSTLAGAIRSGSLEQLVKIPGIGKKTAERLVLELRDKLDLPGLIIKDADPKQAFDAGEEDVISALMNFGAARPAAEGAVRKAKADGGPNDFDNLFRRSLRLVR